MPLYEQTPIRLQVTLVGAPPVYPIDQLTGNAPQFWRASNVALAFGIFDGFGNPVDLSNLTKIQLFLFKSQADLVPLVTKELLLNQLFPLITSLGWANGTQQNGTFQLSPAETDQALGGAASANFWMVLNGVSAANAQILYAAGPAVIFNASRALPAGAMPTPSENAQNLVAGDITVTPTSNIHLEEVTVSGLGGRTSNIIVGFAGLTKGARVDVLLLATGANAAIDIQFFINSLIGANPFAFNTSGGTTRALFKFYFDGATLKPLEQVNPAF